MTAPTDDPMDWQDEETALLAATETASEAEAVLAVPPPPPFASTTGYVITHHGHPCWVGNPDKTEHPTFRVYDTRAQARRALYHIARCTRAHVGDASGFAVGRVRVTVEHLHPEVTIRFRDKDV